MKQDNFTFFRVKSKTKILLYFQNMMTNKFFIYKSICYLSLT